MVNKESCYMVADIVEGKQEIVRRRTRYEVRGFNMGFYKFLDCNSPACIAGHAAVAAGVNIQNVGLGYIRESAKHFLGIEDDDTANELFAPTGSVASFIAGSPDLGNFITDYHAAAVLRHLGDTGIVDWSVGKYEKTANDVV